MRRIYIRPMTGADFLQLSPVAAPARGLTGWLADAIRTAIMDGRLRAGTPLPATRTLAGDLGVSRGVIVEAYQRLADEGLVSGRPGAGTRVLGVPAPAPAPDAAEPGAARPGAARPRPAGPGVDGLGVDGPGADGPGADGPGADGPGADGPGADGPGADGPGVDGPGAAGPLSGPLPVPAGCRERA